MATCDCDCPVFMPGPSGAACGGSTLFLFMKVLEQFLSTQCDIADPCGQIKPVDHPDSEYDFIIIGGGAAGSVLANRLTEVEHFKVLVLEAGGNQAVGSQVLPFSENFIGTSIDWDYKTVPQDHAFLNKEGRISTITKGKVIGGSTSYGSMIYTRGCKSDFNRWEILGNSGWSYDDVLPYFMKSEDNLQIDDEAVDPEYHGVGGYLPVTQVNYNPTIVKDCLEAAVECGQSVGDLNGEYCSRFMRYQTTSKNGVRYTADRAFLRPVQSRKNLHILLNTTATRILVSTSQEKRAYGVEVLTSDGDMITLSAKKEVVLCAGAIGSPKLLLLSGIGDTEDLKEVDVPVIHHLKGVGQNFRSQVVFIVRFRVNNFTDSADLNWATAMKYLLFREGPMSGSLSVMGFFNSKYANASKDYPDVLLFVPGSFANCSETGVIGETNVDFVDGKRVFGIRSAAIRPLSVGYVKLRDKNPFSKPFIDPKYLSQQQDVKTIIEGIKLAKQLSKTKSLEKYDFELHTSPVQGCEGFTFDTDEYWECAIRRESLEGNHHVGTCKMGPASDSMAVVDQYLRVYGVKGLRVIDESCAPELVAYANLAVTYMIAEKGAEMIKKEWVADKGIQSDRAKRGTRRYTTSLL